MLATRVGFTGGTSPDPTYHARGDHAEAVEVDYDPSRISYERLLDLFWEMHDATLAPPAPQYRSGIYVHDRAQYAAAVAAKARLQARLGEEVHTEILPAGVFTLAADAQQKFYLRRRPELLRALVAVAPPPQVAPTVAARLNAGALYGQDPERLRAQLAGLGLGREDVERLVRAAG